MILLDDELSTAQLVIALVVPALVRDRLQAHDRVQWAHAASRAGIQEPNVFVSCDDSNDGTGSECGRYNFQSATASSRCSSAR